MSMQPHQAQMETALFAICNVNLGTLLGLSGAETLGRDANAARPKEIV